MGRPKIKRPDLPKLIGQEQFGELVGIGPTAVNYLAKSGVIQKADVGMVDMKAALQSYTKHLREKAARWDGNANPAGLTEERSRLAKANADSAELKNAIMRKDYLPAADVERVWSNFLRDLRSRIMATPSRLRQQLPALTAAEVKIIDRELRDALEDLGGGTGK